ncbi:MAG: hypothetical protein R3F62_10090 [Planctomycetota bacterium]
MSQELTETLIEPLARLGLTVEPAGLSLRVAADLGRVMTLTASTEGVVFCHQLDPEVGDEAPARVDALNRDAGLARYLCRDTGVWVETFLPFAGRSLTPSQLTVAVGELDLAIQRYRHSPPPAATLIAPAPGGAVTAPLAAPFGAVDRGAPTEAVPRGGVAPTEAVPRGGVAPTEALPAGAVAETVALPTGSASRAQPRHSPSGRAARPRTEFARGQVDLSGDGGGSGGAVLVLGVLVLLVLGGASALGVYVYSASRDVAVSGPGPGSPGGATPTPTAPVADPEPEPALERPPEVPAGGWADLGGEDPAPATTPEPREPDGLPEGWDELLAWIREHPSRALDGLEAAFLRRQFGQEGTWPALVDALDEAMHDLEVVQALTARVRRTPPSVADGLRCLPRARGSFRYALVERVVACAPDERDRVAAALLAGRVEDSADLAIEQGLVRVLRPAPDSLERLLERHGADWMLFGAGRSLLEGLAVEAVGELRPLAGSDSPRIRAAVAELCAVSTDPRAALKLLNVLLHDPTPEVRGIAIESAVKLESPLATWPLARRLLVEEDGAVASQLRASLRQLGTSRGVDLLDQLYGRPRLGDRKAALLGLEAAGTSDAVGVILRGLDDAEPELQLLALHQLARLLRQPGLKPYVRKGTPRIRELARGGSDDAVRGAARDLYVQITGSVPR